MILFTQKRKLGPSLFGTAGFGVHADAVILMEKLFGARC